MTAGYRDIRAARRRGGRAAAAPGLGMPVPVSAATCGIMAQLLVTVTPAELEATSLRHCN